MAALTEKEKLSALVADFGEAMRRTLWFRETIGRKGWNNVARIDLLRASLKEHVEKYAARKSQRQLVDVANIAAFLWYLEGKSFDLPKTRRKRSPKVAP